MKTKDLILRCYAERKDNLWSAVCVDLCLAAQGDSFEQAKSSLEAQISEYVYDAVAGQDTAYASQLLTRKAPLSILFKYHYMKLKVHLHQATQNGFPRLFNETLPMVPASAA